MAADLIKDNVLSAYLGASALAEQENDAEPRGFAEDSDLQARSAARPEVSRLASANASACRVCRSCSACAASTAQQRRRLLILCAGLLPGAQIAERVGRALALLARTKVRSPARPRARHPAPSAPLLCALQVPGPVQALAQRQRRARRRQAAGRRLKPAPVLRGATSTSSTRSPTGRAGRGRGLEVRPRAPHRPLCVRYDPCHPLHRSRTARRPHLPPDPLSPHGRLTPLPHPFAQVLARGPLTSRRRGGGAARRRSGGGLTRPGRPDDPAARRRHRGGAGARRAVAEAVVPPLWRGGADRIYNLCAALVVF